MRARRGDGGQYVRWERGGRGGERLFLYRGRTLDEWLPEVVECIVERFDPLRVILFGSLARGEMGYDSDLLVVLLRPRRPAWRRDATRKR